jgi:hypothetical protein
MELPVPNSSMQHREPKSEIDDTGQILQGASCTIAAEQLNLSFHMHDEPVAASSAASDTARRYLSYESTDSYGPIEVTDG